MGRTWQQPQSPSTESHWLRLHPSISQTSSAMRQQSGWEPFLRASMPRCRVQVRPLLSESHNTNAFCAHSLVSCDFAEDLL